MMHFYFLPYIQLGIFFVVALIAFAVQGIYIAKRAFHYDRRRNRSFFSEVLLLIYMGILVLVPATVYGHRANGIISNAPVENALLILGFGVIIAFALSSSDKKRQRVSAICCVFVSQPVLAATLGISYHILWVIGTMALLLRGYFMISTENARQKEELSTASIQIGLDNLPTGILFCGDDGYIYLVNRKMQSLMLKFLGAELKNGIHLWEKLSCGDACRADCQWIDDDVLIRAESEAWRFARRKFRVNGLNYVEITAIDATKRNLVLKTLEHEQEELAKEAVETAKLAETMKAVKKEREYLRIRSQVHDVLGQQLTAMQRLTQSENTSRYNELIAHSHEAIAQIKGQHQKNAQLFFAEMVDFFGEVGLDIALTPELPRENSIAFLLLFALREACTNAIRHAGATNVAVNVERAEQCYLIEIKNNGRCPSGDLVEGGGLFGIRTRVEEAGGTLNVSIYPEFSIRMQLPSP